MFKFLKEKLKGAISKIGKKAEEEAVEEIKEDIDEKEEEIKKLEEEKKKLEAEEKKVDKELKKKVEEEKKRISEKKKAAEKEKAPEPKKEKAKPAPKKEEAKPKPAPKKTETAKPKTEDSKPKTEKAPEPEIKELEKKKEEIIEEEKEVEAVEEEAKKEKKGLFARFTEKITKTKLSAENFEKLFWELEIILLENNVAVEVIEKIKDDLKVNLVDNPIPRGKVEEIIAKTLKESISEVLSVEPVNVLEEIRKKEGPYVICFIGVNGSGKTTSIAKVASYFKKNKVSCVIAAADTFRAAAIDQMQIHADRLNVRLIRHDYGADAAAVAFDAVKHAQAKKIDAVLVDTAGRLHSNSNLMDEMKKIIRVAKPDLKVFVGESITGNDCIEQAKKFDEAVGIDAIILSKADVDEKGGAAISVSYVTKKPIIFIGTGQEYGDMEAFEPGIVLESLGL